MAEIPKTINIDLSVRLDGVTRIASERDRQKRVKGWDDEHDDRSHNFELLAAASAYMHAAQLGPHVTHDGDAPWYWPWASGDWKPSSDSIRNLEKAGALVAAEIDRLQRKPDADA